jgi:hypothetical protein
MKIFLRWIGLAAGLLLGAPGHAASPKTHWVCWLHGATSAACTLVAAADPVDPSQVRLPALPAARQSGLIHAIRLRPSSLAGQLIFVPLFNVPYDDSLVEQLVGAVLCGSSADCTARYHGDRGRLVAQAPELFADLDDPVLAGQVH